MKFSSRVRNGRTALLLCAFLVITNLALAQSNEVLGEIELVASTKVEKTSGVWVDGQYLGYLEELKGSKKILLLPGKNEIVVKQGGYRDLPIEVAVQPGQKQIIRVAMEKDTRVSMPTITAEIKIAVNPDRAAVFVDGVFIGHVAEFHGVGKALLVAPGKRKIKISLTGYQNFETEVNLVANQKFEIKTDLIKTGSIEPDTPSDQK